MTRSEPRARADGREPGTPDAADAPLAGGLRRVVPSLNLRCPAGHRLVLPAQYASTERRYYCPKCRKKFRVDDEVIKAARRETLIGPRPRKPIPREMDGLYVTGRSPVPDRIRPPLRRLWRRMIRPGLSLVGYALAAPIAGISWLLCRAGEACRRLSSRIREGRKAGRRAGPPAEAASKGGASAKHLATYQELARTFPAVAERLRPIILPDVKVRCPNGHELTVLADLAASGREVFCPQCRTAFLPQTEPAAGVETPEPIRETQRAGRVRGRLGRRAWAKISRMSGWMISCLVHGLLLMVAMLVGVKVGAARRAGPAISLDADINPPREYEMVRRSKHRDIFDKDPEKMKGAESTKVDLPEVAPEMRAKPADEISEDAALDFPKTPVAPLVTEPLDVPLTAIMTRRGRILSVNAKGAKGLGVTTPVRTGRYAPGVTAGLGPGIVALRGSAEERLRAAKCYGGGQETETAVALALKWLAERQLKDGSWQAGGRRLASASDSMILATAGLATLAFLGAGNSHCHGPHKKTVSKALFWLRFQQRKSGCWMNPGTHQQMHAQGIAALALCEAVMMAPDGPGAEANRKAAQKAVDFIVKAQAPYSVWGYRPYPGRAGYLVENSAVIWNGMALKAAKTAGLKVDEKAFMGMAKWLDDAQVGSRYAYSGRYDGKGKTTGDGGSGSACMVASSMMMRFWTGTRPGERQTEGSANIVLAKLRALTDACVDPMVAAPRRKPAVRQGGVIAGLVPGARRDGLYFMHHGSIAMFQMGGKFWGAWHPRVKRIVMHDQYADGHWSGFYSDAASTALGALILESYYRYSPLYHKPEPPPAVAAPPAPPVPVPAPVPLPGGGEGSRPSRRRGKPLDLFRESLAR
ncbi:MAG: prenyltransferase/squalene oxidase repeat-containing protein [Planctomycetota bacterium]|jgi:hypothetical protein